MTREKVVELHNKALEGLNLNDMGVEVLTDLADAILCCDDDNIWEIGEFEVCALSNLVVGAWHAFFDWYCDHAAFWAFDRIYTPAQNESSGTLEGSDLIAYQMICSSLD